MQNAKLLTIALALTGLGFLGAGTAFAEGQAAPIATTPASGTTILADDDDWYDDDWYDDDDGDDRWDD